MFIQGIPRRGHTYYAVISGKRVDGKVVRKTEYYIGSLEKLDEARRVEIEENLKNLGDSALIQKFRSIIISHGYEIPSPISFFSVEKIYEYGRELAIHKVCEEIDFVNLINKHGKKGSCTCLTEYFIYNLSNSYLGISYGGKSRFIEILVLAKGLFRLRKKRCGKHRFERAIWEG
jgi:hypothetical protein